jgi:hypothetical protein
MDPERGWRSESEGCIDIECRAEAMSEIGGYQITRCLGAAKPGTKGRDVALSPHLPID